MYIKGESTPFTIFFFHFSPHQPLRDIDTMFGCKWGRGEKWKKEGKGKRTEREKKIFPFGVFGFREKKGKKQILRNLSIFLFGLIEMKSVFLHLYPLKKSHNNTLLNYEGHIGNFMI